MPNMRIKDARIADKRPRADMPIAANIIQPNKTSTPLILTMENKRAFK